MSSFGLKAISAAVLALTTLSASAADANCPNCFAKRWIYFGGNVAKADQLAALKTLIADAKTHGFNGIALNSGGSGSYTQLLANPGSTDMANLDKNLKELVPLAIANGIELIPVGGGPEVPVAIDPTLTEALPASATYLVTDGVASIVPTPVVTEGTFDVKGGWEMDIGPDANNPYVSIDKTVGRVDDRADLVSSAKLVPGTREGYLNSRLMREFKVSPNKAYRVSFWLKTSAGHATEKLYFHMYPTGSSQPIYANSSSRLGWGTKADGEWNAVGNSDATMLTAGQDWKRYDLDFNSGDKSAVRMYLGTQSVGVAGTAVWVDDLQVQELGLAHPVRRGSTPVVVKPAAGGAAFVEDKDYIIGGADKTTLTIPAGSAIVNGQKLTVSWYQSGVNMTGRWGTPATMCTSDGKYFNTQKALYDKLYGYFGDKFASQAKARYFMYYDEIRLFNWDPSCKLAVPTAGEYLRTMVNGVTAKVKDAYAKPVEILTWNDMFDLKMNAVPSYWYVKGDLSKWQTPLNQDIVIVNWVGGSGTTTKDDDDRRASLAQFAGEGHKQVVALYYDNLASVTNWTDVMATSLAPVEGIMYTTWKGVSATVPYAVSYGDLGKVAASMRTKFPGRWPQ